MDLASRRKPPALEMASPKPPVLWLSSPLSTSSTQLGPFSRLSIPLPDRKAIGSSYYSQQRPKRRGARNFSRMHVSVGFIYEWKISSVQGQWQSYPPAIMGSVTFTQILFPPYLRRHLAFPAGNLYPSQSQGQLTTGALRFHGRKASQIWYGRLGSEWHVRREAGNFTQLRQGLLFLLEWCVKPPLTVLDMVNTEVDFQVAGLAAYFLGMKHPPFATGGPDTSRNLMDYFQTSASWARRPGERKVIWNRLDGSLVRISNASILPLTTGNTST